MGYMEQNNGIPGALKKWDFGGGTTLVTKPKAKKDEANRQAYKTAVAEQTRVARLQQADLLQQAEAAAAQQANLTLLAKVEKEAAAALEKPLEDATVLLQENASESVVTTKARKRKQFGFTTGANVGPASGDGYQTGVNL